MKIAYYVYWNTNREDGVLKKIVRQVHAWQHMGNEVRVFFLSYTSGKAACLKGLDYQRIVITNKWDLFSAPQQLAKSVLEWDPQLIYIRFDKFYPGFGHLFQNRKVVLEINTNDNQQLKVNSTIPVRLYHHLTRNLALKACSGFCFLADETARRFDRFKKPFLVLGDSIDLDKIPVSRAPETAQPHLVFVYSFNHLWNGLEKVFLLARSNPDWIIDVVGPETPLQELAPANVVFHGFLERSEYECVLQNADVGISALSLHRIGIHQNGPLKVRDYLAHGLPCIIAYKDIDFPQSAPFLLELPNLVNNIEPYMGQIREFVHRWKGKRVERSEIAHLDVSYKEKKRIHFFHTLLR